MTGFELQVGVKYTRDSPEWSVRVAALRPGDRGERL